MKMFLYFLVALNGAGGLAVGGGGGIWWWRDEHRHRKKVKEHQVWKMMKTVIWFTEKATPSKLDVHTFP